MKKIILLLLLINSINSYSQDYFIVAKDTTFCKNLSYATTMQGFLKKVNYTSIDGNQITISGRKKVPDVTTFFVKGKVIDKIPLRANKPKSYIRYTTRAVDGKLKVYSALRKNIKYKTATNTYRVDSNTSIQTGGVTASGPAGIYRFFIKMPDGTYYKIDKKKNRKKIIEPYLLKCQEFKNAYKGDFIFKGSVSNREQTFIEIIELYNSLCD